MAKGLSGTSNIVSIPKKTSQGHKNVKRASMNKSRKRSFKKYRGQGK
jgi:hypothetical protein